MFLVELWKKHLPPSKDVHKCFRAHVNDLVLTVSNWCLLLCTDGGTHICCLHSFATKLGHLVDHQGYERGYDHYHWMVQNTLPESICSSSKTDGKHEKCTLFPPSVGRVKKRSFPLRNISTAFICSAVGQLSTSLWTSLMTVSSTTFRGYIPSPGEVHYKP